MGLPPTIEAGPYTYALTRRVPESTDDLGVTNHDTLTVIVSPNLPPDRAIETLLHETLHVVWNLAGIDEKINEEHVVRRLAPHLLDVLRRNPALRDYLVPEINEF